MRNRCKHLFAVDEQYSDLLPLGSLDKTPDLRSIITVILNAVESSAPPLRAAVDQWAARKIFGKLHNNRKECLKRVRKIKLEKDGNTVTKTKKRLKVCEEKDCNAEGDGSRDAEDIESRNSENGHLEDDRAGGVGDKFSGDDSSVEAVNDGSMHSEGGDGVEGGSAILRGGGMSGGEGNDYGGKENRDDEDMEVADEEGMDKGGDADSEVDGIVCKSEGVARAGDRRGGGGGNGECVVDDDSAVGGDIVCQPLAEKSKGTRRSSRLKEDPGIARGSAFLRDREHKGRSTVSSRVTKRKKNDEKRRRAPKKKKGTQQSRSQLKR